MNYHTTWYKNVDEDEDGDDDNGDDNDDHLVNGRGDPENLPVGVNEDVGLVPDLVVPVGAEQGNKLTSSLNEIS